LSKLEDAGFKEGDYILYSPEDLSPKAVQGAEADYVIVNDMPASDEDNYQNLVGLYTYLSRSLVGSLVNIGGYKDSLHLLNVNVPYTSDYSVPGLDTQQEEKKKKIELLESIIGDYKPEVTASEDKKQETSSTTESNTSIESGKTSKINGSEDIKRIEDLVDEGESSRREKSSTIPEYSKANPLDEKPTHMYGYGFYTRTGLKKAGGRYKS
jgi:hypothetical protein